MQTHSDDATLRGQLRASVATFTQRNPGAARIRRLRTTPSGFDAVIWGAMADAGWFGIRLPEALGGLGLGLGELCAVSEALGSGLAPEPLVASSLAVAVVAKGEVGTFGAILAGLCDGRMRAALAWQEVENDLDPLAIATRAEASQGGFILTGTKRFVPSPAGVDGFVVTACAADGVAAYWVPDGTTGVSLEMQRAVDGSMIGTLRLDAASVPASACIVGADRAGAVLADALDEARVAAAAELFGLLQRALAMTVQYCRDRSQFGKPIGSFQALQHRMVDLWIQQEVTRATLADSLAVFARTEDPRQRAVAASAAKARASEAAMLIARQSIQLHGGIGYADEHDIGLFLKRTIVLSGWLGSARIHRRRYSDLAPDWDSSPQDPTPQHRRDASLPKEMTP